MTTRKRLTVPTLGRNGNDSADSASTSPRPAAKRLRVSDQGDTEGSSSSSDCVSDATTSDDDGSSDDGLPDDDDDDDDDRDDDNDGLDYLEGISNMLFDDTTPLDDIGDTVLPLDLVL